MILMLEKRGSEGWSGPLRVLQILKHVHFHIFQRLKTSSSLVPFFTHSIPWGQLGDTTVLLLHSTSKSIYQILVLPFLYDGKQFGILGNRGWHLCCNILLMTVITLVYFFLSYDLHNITLWPKIWKNISYLILCLIFLQLVLNWPN